MVEVTLRLETHAMPWWVNTATGNLMFCADGFRRRIKTPKNAQRIRIRIEKGKHPDAAHGVRGPGQDVRCRGSRVLPGSKTFRVPVKFMALLDRAGVMEGDTYSVSLVPEPETGGSTQTV